MRARNSLYTSRRSLGSEGSRPRLAAIVLNHRTPSDTLLAVRSLLASRRAIDEIVVVDNDIGPQCRHALSDVWSQITFLQTGENLGFSAGMNTGIDAALDRGATNVLLVNSDAVLAPDCVALMETALMSSPSVGIVGPTVFYHAATPSRVSSSASDTSPVPPACVIMLRAAAGSKRTTMHPSGKPSTPSAVV